MMLLRKLFLLLCFLGVSSFVIAQDSLSLTTLQPITHSFSIVDGRLVGEGAGFLKKEIAEAQFTLLGDYPDSKNVSDFTTALLPVLNQAHYKTMALGVGVPSARQLNALAKEPKTLVSKLKATNDRYAITENENVILPMPDMKSVEDAHFIQKAGELEWTIVGFGSESWNNLPAMADQMYAALSPEIQKQQLAVYQECKSILKTSYANRNGDLLQFATDIKNSKPIQAFLKAVQGESSENPTLIEAFWASIESCRMYAQKLYFEKNQLRVNEEKRLLRQELDRIGFDMHQDKLFVKWDMSFLSRGLQPYAFYGVGNTLSEIANYNGNRSLHIGIVPRYRQKSGVITDLLEQENSMAHRLSALVQAAKKDEWTLIDLQKMIQESHYTPVKYLLDGQVQDLIKRYDIIIIPSLEKEATLNYNK